VRLRAYVRAPGDHHLNVARDSAEIGGQLFEKFALVAVSGQPADQIAILSFHEQLFKLHTQVFHFRDYAPVR
jgi:hypothetical protein